MAETLRIGYIGAGGICRQRHLPGFAQIEDVEQVAVANRSVQSGDAVAQEFGLQDVHDDWRESGGARKTSHIIVDSAPGLTSIATSPRRR